MNLSTVKLILQNYFPNFETVPEWIDKKIYPAREHAGKDINEFVYSYYNGFRLHSTLGYKTPNVAHNSL